MCACTGGDGPEAQRWIDNWRIDNSYREFYETSSTVRIKRSKDNEAKTYDFGEFISLQKQVKDKVV